jgi:large subunit ribosomal protein L23
MSIIIKPIITEKVTAQSEKLNRFGFVVARNANKIQIKKAVEELYNVTVEDVNTLRYGSKTKNRSTKSGVIKGRTSAFKKAMVTIAAGETIDFYSNI